MIQTMIDDEYVNEALKTFSLRNKKSINNCQIKLTNKTAPPPKRSRFQC